MSIPPTYGGRLVELQFHKRTRPAKTHRAKTHRHHKLLKSYNIDFQTVCDERSKFFYNLALKSYQCLAIRLILDSENMTTSNEI